MDMRLYMILWYMTIYSCSTVLFRHNTSLTSYLTEILQGRTALWDSILLLCYRIKVAYGGIVRGMHLGSSALAILPVFESEDDD